MEPLYKNILIGLAVVVFFFIILSLFIKIDLSYININKKVTKPSGRHARSKVKKVVVVEK